LWNVNACLVRDICKEPWFLRTPTFSAGMWKRNQSQYLPELMHLELYFKNRRVPKDWMNGTSTLPYCGFDHLTKTFRLFELSLAQSRTDVVGKDLRKDAPLCYGSGAARARVLLKKFAGTPTTKEVLTVLASVIEDSSVPTVGGVPQMVTIWKKSFQLVGFNQEISETTTSTLLGLPLYFQSDMTRVRFLDRQFRSSAYLHSAKLRRTRKNRQR
jgi:hypothetical protein